MAVTTTMKRPETVSLTYDKANPVAKKTLDFFLSLGVFQIQKEKQTEIDTSKREKLVNDFLQFAEINSITDSNFKFIREECYDRKVLC